MLPVNRLEKQPVERPSIIVPPCFPEYRMMRRVRMLRPSRVIRRRQMAGLPERNCYRLAPSHQPNNSFGPGGKQGPDLARMLIMLTAHFCLGTEGRFQSGPDRLCHEEVFVIGYG